jgi:APA family basic amino acid/polyamine antiporter
MSDTSGIRTGVAGAAGKDKTGLKLPTLISLATGTVVGSGIVTLVGISIEVTGRSVWLAYGTAVLLGIVLVAPFIFLSSSLRVRGGNYSFVAAVLGDRFGGVYCLAFTMNAFAMGLFGVSLGNYIKVLIPGVNVTVVAVSIITLFYITNLFGVKFMAKMQNIMFTALMLGLLCYILTGVFRLRQDALDFSSPELFTGGLAGFMSAVMMLIFSTTGHYYVVSFSKEAEKPKRDIPLSIIITSGIILILYVGVAFVTANVLPLEEVAGQPLTVIARRTMPVPLYYLFVFGGPVMALTTTINSNFTIFSRPFEQATKDGWFPISLATHNKAGVPWKLITLMYLIGISPLILRFNIRQIVGYTVLVDSISELVAYVAIIKFPVAIEGAWENRYFKFPRGFFYTIMMLSILVRLALIVLSFNEIDLPIGIATVVLFLLFFVYAFWREKSGKIIMEKSCELY